MILNNICFFKDNFPKWIDLRSKGACLDILDDLNLNISAISSVVNCIRYLLKQNNKKDFLLSRMYLYYCIKNADFENTLNFINEKGVCSEKDWTYDLRKIYISPDINVLQYFKLDFKPVKNKIKYIKYELMNNRPVLVELNKTFYNITYTAIYGYRNSINCFICMHSAGKNWKEKGFFLYHTNMLKNIVISYSA